MSIPSVICNLESRLNRLAPIFICPISQPSLPDFLPLVLARNKVPEAGIMKFQVRLSTGITVDDTCVINERN